MSASHRCVFVVDDEPVIAVTLAAILRIAGYDVRSFTDPQQALEALKEGCPDLLISDVMMPGLTGVELASPLKQICPGCRNLLISGEAATADLLSSAWESGHHFEVLSKPIPPPHLIETIKQSFCAVA